MDQESTILCEVEDGVAVLTLNRPDRLNAFTPAMNGLYDELMVALERDGVGGSSRFPNLVAHRTRMQARPAVIRAEATEAAAA